MLLGAGVAGVEASKVAAQSGQNTTDQYSSNISFTLNGKSYSLTVKNNMTLAELLRIQLGLTGTKIACNRGECGACTVLINDRTHYSCSTLAVDVNGKDVTTIEGLVQNGTPDPVQQAWVDNEAEECGYCSPGFIMSAKAAIKKYGKSITPEQVISELSGNICRCSAYQNMIPAVLEAASKE